MLQNVFTWTVDLCPNNGLSLKEFSIESAWGLVSLATVPAVHSNCLRRMTSTQILYTLFGLRFQIDMEINIKATYVVYKILKYYVNKF